MNKSKSLLNLAVAGIAGSISVVSSILVAPSASAVSFCYFGPNPPAPGTPVCADGITLGPEGDKLITLESNPVLNGFHSAGGDASGFFEFQDFMNSPPGPIGDDFSFDVEFFDTSDSSPIGITNGTGEIEYTIDIVEDGLFFSLVTLDSSIGLQDGVTVTKEIFVSEGGMMLDELTSTDGSRDTYNIPENLKLTSLFVRDSYTVEDGAVLNFFENDFGQRPHEKSVPEPASILGILAVGGLGLGLKRKKQS